MTRPLRYAVIKIVDASAFFFSREAKEGFIPGTEENDQDPYSPNTMLTYHEDEKGALIYANQLSVRFPGTMYAVAEVKHIWQCPPGTPVLSVLSEKGLIPV